MNISLLKSLDSAPYRASLYSCDPGPASPNVYLLVLVAPEFGGESYPLSQTYSGPNATDQAIGLFERFAEIARSHQGQRGSSIGDGSHGSIPKIGPRDSGPICTANINGKMGHSKIECSLPAGHSGPHRA